MKQSPRCWNYAIRTFVESLGFKQCDADPCIYIHPETQTSVAVYVDDLILVTKTDAEMANLKNSFSTRFKMKDIGPIHYCLGITIEKSKGKLKMHQKQYIDNIIAKYGLCNAHTVSTPADTNVNLCKHDEVSQPANITLYQSMTGSLLYVVLRTRPDIAQAVGAVTKFNVSPSNGHSCEKNIQIPLIMNH